MTSGSTSLFQPGSHLWKAACPLKTPVDAAAFKTYMFPLLFFKQPWEVHEEVHRWR